MNLLELRYALTNDDDEPARLTLRPFVDGRDLLIGHRNNLGLDPDLLLPPLSTSLLPTRRGHVTLIGSCSCGETGCGSLSARVTRTGGEVRWEPEARPHYETLANTCRFDLREYLDAIDDAAGAPPPEEGRGRRVARIVQVMLGRHDQTNPTLALFHRGALDWIGARGWTSDLVDVSLTVDGEREVFQVVAAPGESDHEMAVRIAARIDRTLLIRER